MNRRSSCVVWVLLFGGANFFSSHAYGQVYVSKTGDNTLGTSWSTALFSLSDAVAQAQSSVQDVWIASDSYTILSTVSVPSNVNIYGDFPATGNPGFPDRDPNLHPTTLDGGNAASPILEYSGSTNLEIDGITFRNANGNRGGAIRVVNFSDVDILNCRFIENVASSMGAGIYIDTAHADVEDCVFEDNLANEAAALMLFRGTANVIRCEFRRNDGGGQGGAILAFEEPLYVDRCIFEENEGARGGAIAVREGFEVTITNTLFRNNFSSDHGAGINFEFQNGVVVANCTFVDNTASTRGGGVFLHSSSGAVSNCIFVNNNNHAIYENDNSADPTVLNNLFYANPDGVYFDEASFSIELAEGPDGLNTLLAQATGNLDGDPIFVFPQGGDYHIQLASPAVDEGATINAPLVDFDGELRPVDIASVGIEGMGVAFDIGYDEYLDTDGDGMPDYWEFLNGLDPASSAGDDGALGDADGDGLTNLDEYEIHHTGASTADSDGDGISDGDEISDGTDPLDANSFSTSEIWVDFSFLGTSTGSVSAPYKTMETGIAAVDTSGILHVVSGSSPFLGIVSKPMTIVAEGGSVQLGVP